MRFARFLSELVDRDSRKKVLRKLVIANYDFNNQLFSRRYDRPHFLVSCHERGCAENGVPALKFGPKVAKVVPVSVLGDEAMSLQEPRMPDNHLQVFAAHQPAICVGFGSLSRPSSWLGKHSEVRFKLREIKLLATDIYYGSCLLNFVQLQHFGSILVGV